jgi:hypothetical protein
MSELRSILTYVLIEHIQNYIYDKFSKPIIFGQCRKLDDVLICSKCIKQKKSMRNEKFLQWNLMHRRNMK